jgi:CheY-like chemotaxis protein
MFAPRGPTRLAGRPEAGPGVLPDRVLVPVAREALSEVAHSLRQTSKILNTARLVVLLVDDCPFQQLLGCALLSHWGIMPQLASNGCEAVALAAEQDFDIILMDVDMPVMDGLRATAEIRRMELQRDSFKRVPVVAYTAGHLAANPTRWHDCGMDAVLMKPCDADVIGACLEQWCLNKFRSIQH